MGKKSKRHGHGPQKKGRNTRQHLDSNTEATDPTGGTKKCSHVTKAIKLGVLQNQIPHLKLGQCSTCNEPPGQDASICLCLRCGKQGCGRYSDDKHGLGHYQSTPSHSITVNLQSFVVWCYTCDIEIPVVPNTDLHECIKILLKALKMEGQPHENQLLPRVVLTDVTQDEEIMAKHYHPQQRVKGLVNLGNTCFFNAVMQNLGQTELLHIAMACSSQDEAEEIIPSIKDKLPGLSVKVTTPTGSLTAALAKLLEQMKSPTSGPLNPKHLFAEICKKAPRFRGFQQQDSQELLRYLLDSLKTEQQRRIKIGILNAFGIRAEGGSLKQLSEEKKNQVREYVKVVSPTVVDSVFGGQLDSIVVCHQCHKESRVTETFLDLSLSLTPVQTKTFQANSRHRKANSRHSVTELKSPDRNQSGKDENKKTISDTSKKLSKHQQKAARKADRKKGKSNKGRPRKTSSSISDDVVKPASDHSDDELDIMNVSNDADDDNEAGLPREDKGRSNGTGPERKIPMELSEPCEEKRQNIHENINDIRDEETKQGNSQENKEKDQVCCAEKVDIENGCNEEESLEASEKSKGLENEEKTQEITNVCNEHPEDLGVNQSKEYVNEDQWNNKIIIKESGDSVVVEIEENSMQTEDISSKEDLVNESNKNDCDSIVAEREDNSIQAGGITSTDREQERCKQELNGSISLKDHNESSKNKERERLVTDESNNGGNYAAADSESSSLKGTSGNTDTSTVRAATDSESSSLQDTSGNTDTSTVTDLESSSLGDASNTTVKDNVYRVYNEGKSDGDSPKCSESECSSVDSTDVAVENNSDVIKQTTSDVKSLTIDSEDPEVDSRNSERSNGIECATLQPKSLESDRRVFRPNGSHCKDIGQCEDVSSSSSETKLIELEQLKELNNPQSFSSKEEHQGQQRAQLFGGNELSSSQIGEAATNEIASNMGMLSFKESDAKTSLEAADLLSQNSEKETLLKGRELQDIGANNGENKCFDAEFGNSDATMLRLNGLPNMNDEARTNTRTDENISAESENSDKTNGTLDTEQEMSNTTPRVLTLSSPYIPSPGECSLQSCLSVFCAPEVLEGNNKFACEECTKARHGKVENSDADDDSDTSEKDSSSDEGAASGPKSPSPKRPIVYTEATKQLLLSSTPPVLTLHLKRFQQVGFGLRKVSKQVEFPLVLDLAPFCSKQGKNLIPVRGQILYSLIGVVEHSGGLNSGHYTAYIKVKSKPTLDLQQKVTNLADLNNYIQNTWGKKMGGEFNDGDFSHRRPDTGQWYYVSDTHSTMVPESKVTRSQAYMLFYERLPIIPSRNTERGGLLLSRDTAERTLDIGTT